MVSARNPSAVVPPPQLPAVRQHRLLAVALSTASLTLVTGCTIPINWFGPRPPVAPTPKATAWETDTRAGAKALNEGRLEDAERDLQRARERAAAGTNNDLEMAASLVNLAVLRRAQGDAAGALELQQEALALREKALGPDHPDVAASLNSIAALDSSREDFAAAEPLLTRALAIREHALGRENRYTAQSLNNLALLYAAQGRYADAEPLYQRSVAILEKQQHPDDLATVLENYAALLADAGRGDEAKQMDTRARAIRATLSGT